MNLNEKIDHFPINSHSADFRGSFTGIKLLFPINCSIMKVTSTWQG
ncbi:hypothetical protein HOLDEFILI_02259 [Holdemania filiformis DSM 12042]|uniref:Uncharacterized protein n=1 Tax=Holdemania filiformis DSM 12042 TaxID=545696 RepID=B9Y8V9_9FIRM|nr:hypothetical protein HOLDEFILI_02259 [Holdemania filiformis DSM 12042]